MEALKKLLLATEPEIIDFPSEDTEAERKKRISDLKNEDRNRLFDMIYKDLDDIYGIEEKCDLYQLMKVDNGDDEDDEDDEDNSDDDLPDWEGISPDWRLRIFRGPTGVFYDYNGWPGDNESGSGVYYDASGSMRIFENNDQSLIPVDEKHAECVDMYSKIRNREENNEVISILGDDQVIDITPGEGGGENDDNVN